MWIFLGAESFMATCILATGMVDDLRSRKVHNKLVLVLFALSLSAALFLGGWGLAPEILLAIFASLLFIPLSLLGLFGGGDVKLLFSASPLMGWKGVLACAALSLLWGAALGLLQSLFDGELKALLIRTTLLLRSPKAKELSMSRVPYTVALLLGWMTYLTLLHYEVQL